MDKYSEGFWQIGNGAFFQQASLAQQKRPTKRAPDVWDSAAFSSIFLASAFSYFQTESTPAHTQATQIIGAASPQNSASFMLHLL
jgi:hypothetical protein